MSNLSSSISLALSSAHFTGTAPSGGQSIGHSGFFQAIFDSMMQGFLILNERREIIQSNSRARELCQQLERFLGSEGQRPIPEPVWNVCRSLLSSRQEFPGYDVIPEAEIELGDLTHLKVSAQWFQCDDLDETYMLVTLEDRSAMLRNLARWDAYRYGLTAREAEVWLLKCQGYSYDEIADQLYISRNTVKKHLKSISLKREGSLA